VVLLEARLAAVKRALAAIAFASFAGGCFAANGHHAVDDASVQDEDVCRYEAWGSAGDDLHLLHAGGGCGFRLIQVAVAVERVRSGGQTLDTPSLQFKWARDVSETLALGWEVSPSAPGGHLRDATVTAVGLATWKPNESLHLDLNIGRDLPRTGPGFARGGVAAEWWPRPEVMLLVERYLDTGTHFARTGVHWFMDEEWSLDISRAQRLHGPGVSTWTLGISREFKVR
jgi:hypothetical protein